MRLSQVPPGARSYIAEPAQQAHPSLLAICLGYGRTLLLILVLALVLCPFFFIIERLSLFNTVPRDDYAGYLLWLARPSHGSFPIQSPYGYRILSILLAMPFYRMLPPVLPTNLAPTVTLEYARATAALTATSFICLVMSCVGIWRLALHRHQPATVAVGASMLLFIACWYTQIVALDTVTIAAIVAGLWILPHRRAFMAFILASVAVNEKIMIVFMIWLTLRYLLNRPDRQALAIQWLGTLAAAALYLAVIKLVHLPGNSYQMTPSCFLDTIGRNLATTLSLRGFILNAVPAGLLLALGLAATSGRRAGRALPDLLLVPALVLVAMTLTETYQIGRIVMHGAPLLVIPGAAALARLCTPPPARHA